ncbi:MAG TPA: alpha/beta hydrolase [Spirochaetota bacterium]|nr:alpha/beta hydrolase [Spirochaetota bacterium]
MKFKKVLLGLLVGLALIAITGFLVVRSWTITPHGRLDPRVAAYLKLTGAAEKSALELNVPVEESRRRLAEKAASVSGPPITMASVKDMKATANGLSVPVRVYTPEGAGPFPAVLFYHGGGWVQGSVDTHDWPCRAIAKKSGAVVVSAEYRLAPEHPYPAAIDDAYAALLWVRANGKILNADTTKIAVAGDSAGGNLAAAVCLMSRDRKGPAIAFQALIYPSLDAAYLNTESYRIFAKGYMLDRANIDRFIGMYLPNRKDRTAPYASPLLAKDHRNLPPALVITAAFDVLRDEGEAYAKKLGNAGVPARAVRYPGLIHGFVSAPRLLPQSVQAIEEIAAELRKAFGVM